MFHNVELEGNVLHDGWLPPLGPRRDYHGGSRIPIVPEDIAFNSHPAGNLEFENVLDHPGRARVCCVVLMPLVRLVEVIAFDFDIRRHQPRNCIGRSAKHQILPGAFNVIIDDTERSGAVPSANRLRILPLQLESRYVGVDDFRHSRVQGDSAPRGLARSGVDVAAINDDVAR